MCENVDNILLFYDSLLIFLIIDSFIFHFDDVDETYRSMGILLHRKL